jgi:chromosome segregation ATPase
MARRIYSEDLVLNLIVNGKETQAGSKKLLNELYKLDREAQALQQKLAGVELKIRQLDKNAAGYSNTLKRLNAEKKKLTSQINANNAAMNKLRQEIGRDGLTINQLTTYLKVLNVQLRNTTDKGALANLRREIRLTEDRIRHLQTGASRMSIAFERLGTVANKFGTVMSWLAIGTFLFARAVGGTIGNLR